MIPKDPLEYYSPKIQSNKNKTHHHRLRLKKNPKEKNKTHN